MSTVYAQCALMNNRKIRKNNVRPYTFTYIFSRKIIKKHGNY